MRLYACLLTAALTVTAFAQQPFTLQQILSAPYANQLTAAPVGGLFAWVEDAEGRHNLWVGGKDVPARELTHYTEDDGQDIRQLAWSPDARFIAYTYGAESGADGKPANPAHLQRPTPLMVIVQPVDGSAKALLIGEGRSPLFELLRHQLLFLREGQIWSADFGVSCISEGGGCNLDVSKDSIHQLVFDRGAASSLTLSPDGDTLAFISRRREINQPARSYLALYSLTTHTLTFPAPSTGDDSAPAWSPDGKQLAWLRAPFTQPLEYANPRTSAISWSIQLLDVATQAIRTVYSPAPNEPGSVMPEGAPLLFFNAWDRLVFESDASGWTHLYYLDPAKGSAPQDVRTGSYDVESAAMAPDGRRLVFTTNADEYEALGVRAAVVDMGPFGWTSDALNETDAYHLVDHVETINIAGRQVDTSLIPICCRYATQPQINHEGTLGALVSDARYPMAPAAYRIEADERRFVALRTGWPKGYPAASLVAPEPVTFPSTDGLTIHGQLFLPKGKPVVPPQKRPAILFLHGGPMRQMLLGYPAMEYYSNAYAMNQYLTSCGFIVLSVNYRGGTGYGLDFREAANYGPNGVAEYNDVLAAAKYLASRPDVDAKRIGLWGGSYGGYLTGLALARNSDIFAAGVDFHGVHDWNLEDNAGDWKRGNNAEQDAIGKLALASSPLGDISKWRSPILLIHGDNDPSVAYAQTPILADALRARNSHLSKEQQVDVEELIFPDEVHEFLLHKDWLAAYTAAAAFFERTLKPEAVK